MLFRCMLIVFLLMMSVIPAWANKKDAPPFDLPIEFQSAWECVQSGTIPPMEPFPTKFLKYTSEKRQSDSPWNKLCIKTESWTVGNTFFTRYTFTNPTDEQLDKIFTHADICYSIYRKNKSRINPIQHSNVIRTLSLSPHSSQSFLVPLTIKEPFDLIQINSTNFYGTDNSMIGYYLRPTETTPNILMTPIVLPSGELYIAMKNHHATEAISNIREIVLNATFLKTTPIMKNNEPIDYDQTLLDFSYIDAKQLPLRLKPQETIFFRLPQTFTETNDSITLRGASLSATINDIKYVFTPYPQTLLVEAYNEHRVTYTPAPTRVGTELSGTWEIDSKGLHGYLRFKNPSSETLYYPSLTMSTILSYYNSSDLLDIYCAKTIFPENIVIAPNQESLLSFSIPLPSDVIAELLHSPRLQIATSLFSNKRVLPYYIKWNHQKLSPSEKNLYIREQKTLSSKDFDLVIEELLASDSAKH